MSMHPRVRLLLPVLGWHCPSYHLFDLDWEKQKDIFPQTAAYRNPAYIVYDYTKLWQQLRSNSLPPNCQIPSVFPILYRLLSTVLHYSLSLLLYIYLSLSPFLVGLICICSFLINLINLKFSFFPLKKKCAWRYTTWLVMDAHLCHRLCQCRFPIY